MNAIPDNHPLLLHNLSSKGMSVDSQWVRGTVSVVDGYGSKGPKPRPFKQDHAVKQFQSWVHRAAMLNAMAFAAVPLRLYVRKRSNTQKHYQTAPVPNRRKRFLSGEGQHRPSHSVVRKIAALGSDYEEVTESHPALQLLSTVNSWQNGFELAALRSLYWQVTGNAYVYPVIHPGLGVPSELYLLPSQWVQVIPSRTDFIAGYVYGRKPDQVQFTADEVIQWKLPSLTDVYYGMGWVEALWTALGLHNAKRVMDTAKMDNMARPDWLLVVKSGATTNTLDRLEATIESKLQGSKNSGRFLSVTGDVEAIPLNFDETELGDPEKVISEISAVSGVPLNKLLGNDPVKANSETQDIGWLRDTILPYCRLDEEQLNARYLPLFDLGEDAVLAYDSPVPDNRSAQVDLFVKQAGGPYLTVNEVRTEDGEQPIEGGDQLRQPLGPKADANPDKPASPDQGKQMMDASKQVTDVLEAIKKSLAALGDTQKKTHRIGNTHDGLARVLPNGFQLQAIMVRMFNEQRRAVLDQVSTKSIDEQKPEPLPAAFIPLDDWTPEIAKEARPAIELIMKTEGQRLLARVGASHDVVAVFEKNIPKAAEQLALKFAESTNATTTLKLDEALSALRLEISEGLTEGDTRIQLAKRVNEIFDEAETSRAETIARTEGSRAAHEGELMSAKESGVVSRKFWLLSSDACAVCQKIEADNPDGIPLDKTFAEFGGEYGSISGPPGHVNCQCSLTYSVKDDGSR